MKTLKKLCLVAVPLLLLSSCYVQVENGHRHWHWHHHHDEVIIEKR